MKVFSNRYTGEYGSALILVGADSTEQALEVYLNDPELAWQYADCWDTGREYYYYAPENWEEVPGLEWHGGPCVIKEANYVE